MLQHRRADMADKPARIDGRAHVPVMPHKAATTGVCSHAESTALGWIARGFADRTSLAKGGSMSRTYSLADRVLISEPCPASWDAMSGDHRVRHCAQCDKSVHNLSAMTEGEAHRLIDASNGQLCVNYVPDAHGRPITTDRPLALSPVRVRRHVVTFMIRFGRLAACIGLGGLFARYGVGCTSRTMIGAVRTGGRLAAPEPEAGESSSGAAASAGSPGTGATNPQ